MYNTVFTIILTLAGSSQMNEGGQAIMMVKVEEVVVTKSGKVPTTLIE